MLIPLGIALAVRMLPSEILAECREKARVAVAGGKPDLVAAGVVVAVWVLLAGLAVYLLWGMAR